MAERLDQIMPAVPVRIAGRIGLDRGAVEIEKLPEPDEAPDRHRKGQFVRRRFVLHRLKGAQIRHQVAHVLDAHMGVIDVGQRRIIVPAKRGYAAHQGIGEVNRSPAADPVIGIRRDVWRMKRAELRCERQAAAEAMPIRLPRCGMT